MPRLAPESSSDVPPGGQVPEGMLVYFHCRSNTGYAIRPAEEAFLRVAEGLVGAGRVLFAYPQLDRDPPAFLPSAYHHLVFQFDPRAGTTAAPGGLDAFLRSHNVRTALGFDQPVRAPGNRMLRKAGVRTLVSYWGATMSSPNRGLRLLLKRLEVGLVPHQPNHYIFESEAMRDLAVRGRGIPRSRTSVCYTGVDTVRFSPGDPGDDYAHRSLGIPRDRAIIYYAGHFEPRKGVDVVLRAARELVDTRKRRDVHFVLTGNRAEDELRLRPIVDGSDASTHVTFAGYRTDAPRLTASSRLAVIASTGWDSFPMTSLEVAACGLPLIASRLHGLVESVADGVTGYLFTPGNHIELADRLVDLLDDRARYEQFSRAARARVLERFTRDHQVACLTRTILPLLPRRD